MNKEIIIFGAGGVGSWLAEFITRMNMKEETKVCEKLTIVDFDTIERKNLQRQDFVEDDIGRNKTKAIIDRLSDIVGTDIEDCWEKGKANGIVLKIETPTDLLFFNSEALAIICTDNLTSKNLISTYFQNKLIISCDKDFYEIKTRRDETDEKVWTIQEGYSSRQDLISNIFVVAKAISILEEDFTGENWKTRGRTETTLNEMKIGVGR